MINCYSRQAINYCHSKEKIAKITVNHPIPFSPIKIHIQKLNLNKIKRECPISIKSINIVTSSNVEMFNHKWTQDFDIDPPLAEAQSDRLKILIGHPL